MLGPQSKPPRVLPEACQASGSKPVVTWPPGPTVVLTPGTDAALEPLRCVPDPVEVPPAATDPPPPPPWKASLAPDT
jgi:hypothetical protein